jgi:hypothetical protein
MTKETKHALITLLGCFMIFKIYLFIYTFFDATKLYYGIRDTYKNSYETRNVRGGYKHSCPTHLTQRTLRKNYTEGLGSHQQTPSTAAFKPTLAATTKEEPMAAPELEEPHCLKGLKKPQEAPDTEAGMKNTL